MDRMLYIAMSGASQVLQAQTATNNNLANVSTTGFRGDFSQFRSQPVFGPGQPSRVFAMSERPTSDFAPGPIESTGRELDVALRGEGWLAVQAPDGSEALTRAGDLKVTDTGQLVTGSGLPVLGNGGPIAVPPSQKMEIGDDGTISIVPLGAQPNEIATLDRIKLVNPPVSTLEKGLDGLMRRKDGAPADADAGVRLVHGALEGSNVSSVGALAELIDLSRRFELQIKAMHTADQNEEAALRTMRLSS